MGSRIKSIVKIINYVLLAFAFAFVIYTSTQIYNYGSTEEDSFYSKQALAMGLAVGLLLCLLSCLAICDLRKNDDIAVQHLFIYWLVVTFLLVINVVGLYYFRVFIRGVRGESDSENSGEISALLELEAEKQLNDLIVSSYTACCTGCDKADVPECKDDLQLPPPFCSESRTAADLGSTNATCVYAESCTQGLPNSGLDSGCYINARSGIPNYDNIGADTCKTLAEWEGDDGKALVGNPLKGSCGGGNPAEYLKDVKNFLESKAIGIFVFWGFMTTLLFIVSIGSTLLICFPKLRDS